MTTDHRLRTQHGAATLAQLRPAVEAWLEAMDSKDFREIGDMAAAAHATVDTARDQAIDDDALADLFVLDQYVRLLHEYGTAWQLILEGKFGASWNSLQNALDALRLLKRHSSLDFSYFERQLVELESAYGYAVFFSAGMQVDYFECSVCGSDIDSVECPHRRGELHEGHLIYGIAHEIVAADHVALVSNPRDKRCVALVPDDSDHFRLIRYIANMIGSQGSRLSDFSHLEWGTRPKPNPDFVELGRNDTCFCGSGKKFKHCCIDRRTIDGDHVDVIIEPGDIRRAVV